MENQEPEKPKNKPTTPKTPKFNIYWVYGIILVVLCAIQFFPFGGTIKDITEPDFFKLDSSDVQKVVLVNNEYAEVYIREDSLLKEAQYKDVAHTNMNTTSTGPHYKFKVVSAEVLQNKLDRRHVNYSSESRTDWWNALSWLLPIGIIVLIWVFIMRRMSGGMGGGGGQIFNFGKNKATLFEKGTKVTTSFNDVAGLDEAKEEVMEIVDFLKNPKKYTTLGGKIPKGALLVGPPGTGKTLLAKAMAGEAQVPFFSISGSDFVELFVGVGASRVRDLFKQAREKAPCVIFIDEVDAIGRARGRNMIQGGNDERENTLNALLVEMDGFAGDAGIIIIAATNRPDVLDPALLRPGRFDRQISIDKPDLVGREQIFRVHIKNIKFAKTVNLPNLAQQTPGFAGADIANVCNEAALIAARRGKKEVEMIDFQDAIDRVIGGLEKKNKIISPDEKRIVAYHEAGHAVCGWFLEHADPLVKVSIIPRGVAALGYAQYMPKEQFLYTTEQMLDGICMTLGGRAAEEIIFGMISTGAQNDLERITKMSYAMVSIYGMNEKIGNVSFNDTESEYGSFTKPYSDETARMIDEEVRTLIATAYVRTKKLLTDKKTELEALAQELLKREVLLQSDLEAIIGKRPWEIKGTVKLEESPVEHEPDAAIEPKTEVNTEVPPVNLGNITPGLG